MSSSELSDFFPPYFASQSHTHEFAYVELGRLFESTW